MTTYATLRDAIAARMIEWDGQSATDIGHSFYGNELAGEIGEAISAATDLLGLAAAAGRVSNVIKKLDRERLGMVGSRATHADLAHELADVLICLRRIEVRFDVNADQEAAIKFNATSDKNGLRTRVKETIDEVHN